MSQSFWTEKRIAGAVLAASLLLLVLAAGIMLATGAIAGFGPRVSDNLAAAGPYASTFRLLILMFAVAWIVQLLGLGLLGRLLYQAGSEQLAALALGLVAVATIVGFLYSTFQMSVETWATEVAAQTGNIPEFFEPLRTWMSDTFGVAYRLHFIAMAGFGFAILRTGVLSARVGSLAIGWSAVWLAAGLFGVGVPGLPFLMPAVIGFALLSG